jgi:YhcH/YjgK/YiaL family protein
MIFDSINNAEIYYGLGEKFKIAFQFLQSTDFGSLKDDKIVLDGDNIFAMIQKYKAKNIEDTTWETHKKYIDIQYIVSGTEKMGFVSPNYLDTIIEYNKEKDVERLFGKGDFVQVRKGEFVIFFPDDAHMPGIKIEGNEMVHKVVIKVKV